MNWNYREPLREDYETEEEYQEALDIYERALDDYIDLYEEMRHWD